MRTSVAILGGGAFLSIGYVLGASGLFSPASLWAQAKPAQPAAQASGVTLSDETKAKIKTAADALKAAVDALTDENKYRSATKGVNSFAVLTGGGNSFSDLTSTAVVDPETFAALYADLATDEVAADLGRDAEGRLTYKNKVVRMYPLSRLRALYAVRAELTGEELLPAVDGEAPRGTTKPASDESGDGDQ